MSMTSRPMIRRWSLPAFLLVLALITSAYLRGVAGVPFHPDESTQLFTSADVEMLFQRPADLFWRAENEADPRQRYRELDAPLTHAVIAAGRRAAGLAALPADWDWGKSWQANQSAGALPSPDLLLAGRMAVALLFPFSVLFLFLAARRVSNDFTAWVAALLLASNALVLLHTRRAMAEGALLFTLTLSLWSLVKAEKRPWLTGIPAALALCAKQSLAALAPVGLLAALWPAGEQGEISARPKPARRLVQFAAYGAVFAAVFFLLNPFLWAQPVPALQAAIQRRQALAKAQTADRPDQALNTPGRKLIALVGSVYLTPPVFAEAANYQENTRAAEQAYLADPLNALFRSLPGGALLLVAGLAGFALAGLRVLRGQVPDRRGLALLLAASLAQALTLLIWIPLPWQRYYLPAVPYACLWAAVSADELRRLVDCAVRRSPSGSLRGKRVKYPG